MRILLTPTTNTVPPEDVGTAELNGIGGGDWPGVGDGLLTGYLSSLAQETPKGPGIGAALVAVLDAVQAAFS